MDTNTKRRREYIQALQGKENAEVKFRKLSSGESMVLICAMSALLILGVTM